MSPGLYLIAIDYFFKDRPNSCNKNRKTQARSMVHTSDGINRGDAQTGSLTGRLLWKKRGSVGGEGLSVSFREVVDNVLLGDL
jgi:hypothetical protein